MAGYDLSSKNPYRLMKGRLGIYEKHSFESSSVDGVKHQNTRLQQMGGNLQQERMILDKRRSLDHAVWYSYQAAEVRKVDSPRSEAVRALINPNKLKQDYDDKILSVGYEYHFKTGDVFEWIGTNTYWLIYLQDLTELAYFRGDIRKCSYEISWKDEEGEHSTYAAVRGPVETKINYIQKHGISVDIPNYSLNILLPKNENTLNYFKRYSKFYLGSADEITKKICWRIEAVDTISTPGIIEIAAVEYYANETEDNIEEGIVGDLIVEPINPNPPTVEKTIVGETFIRPKKEYIYTIEDADIGQWKIDSKLPIENDIFVNEEGKAAVKLKWLPTFSGQFVLSFGPYNKTIIVESLF